MLQKFFNLFGQRQINVERNRDGVFTYEFLNADGFHENDKYLELSLNNPVLMTVISLIAKTYSQMKIIHEDLDGNVIENSDVLRLLSTPNYFQTQQDFLFQHKWFLSATGNNLIYTIKTFKNELPKCLYNLIPSDIDFKEVNKLDKFIISKKDGIAFGEQKIKYTLDSKTYELRVDELIPFYDLASGLKSNSFLRSPSRVQGIRKPLQNIEENLNSKNTNLFFSQKYLGVSSGDGYAGTIKEDDKRNILTALRSKNFLASNSKIDVTHLVSNMKNLFLDEQFSEDAMKVLLAYDMNKDVLNYFSKQSTFENQEKGELKWIQNSIQTSADNDMNSFSQQFGLFEKGQRLRASFNHLPIMQSVMLEKWNAFKSAQESIKLALENKTITDAEAKEKTQRLIKDLGI